jgi:hypothetical protein
VCVICRICISYLLTIFFNAINFNHSSHYASAFVAHVLLHFYTYCTTCHTSIGSRYRGCWNTSYYYRRDSSVGIATGYGLDSKEVGVLVPLGARLFSSLRFPDLLWWSSQPPIQWVPWALSSGVKRSGRQADHSPLASAEIKNTRIYTSTPPYVFIPSCLIS